MTDTATEKAIGTGALEDGGKLHPAHLPGDGSELLDKPPRRKITVITDTIKIRDVATYDPRDVSDAVLRDDFRIVLAWWSAARRGVEVPYDRQTMIRLATAIVKEAVRRGPEVIRFNPPGMTTGARELFELAARRAGVPDRMYKAVTLEPDLDPEDLATDELREAHDRLHRAYRRAATGGAPAPGLSVEGAVNLHARIVDELEARNVRHPAPPDDGLDAASGPFESEPPRDEVPVRKRFAVVNPSGVTEGPEIRLEDVLEHFHTFKLRKPYVYLVGGLANHGKTVGDIDVLIRDSEWLPEEFKHALHFRLGRALPAELAPRLSLHYDNFHGPFTNHVPLYDLVLEADTRRELIEMRAPDTSE